MKRSEVVKTINGLQGETGHQEVLRVYNSQKPLPRGYQVQTKDSWCAATVSAVYILNGYTGVAECSCTQMIKKAIAAGIWQERDDYIPKPGDAIMYDWQDTGTGGNIGVADHTGIVIACDTKAGTITVREGNKNNSIGNRTLKINGRYIRGFITPKFEEETNQGGAQGSTQEKTEEYNMPTIKQGSKGKAVAIWQIIVDAKPDGTFGAETVKATKIWQQNHKLTADGVVGKKSWSAALNNL